MDYKHFLDAIVSYFGTYRREGLAKEVLIHVKGLAETELFGLLTHLKNTVSTQFGFVPDIEAIEKARDQIQESKPKPVHEPKEPETEAKSLALEDGDFMKTITAKRAEQKENPGPEDESLFQKCENGHVYYGSACKECFHKENGTE